MVANVSGKLTTDELGDRFLALGAALKDQETTQGDLVGLAAACGLRLMPYFEPVEEGEEHE